MIWTIAYEYDCQGSGDIIYCLADDWPQAREIAKAYLVEEYLWDRVGDINMDVSLTRHKISPGALLLY